MDELMTIDLVPGTSKQTRISKDLEPSFRDKLVTLLRSNMDVFAWQSSDLTGIAPRTAVHRLNLKPECKPIKQKRRHLGAEKDEIIKREVQRLLDIGHIREIQFPTWLSNAVLVQKASGQWRMCIDFRDLNNACSKDDYPLPRIDQLVDATAGCELLSMMDASQGYHQTPLDEKDQSAVSFITATGTYCYVVMSFGLKNAGATSQRLMDKMFRTQLGHNIEVYVDDMLVKSKKRSTHLADLAETFATLRLYGMNLNPKKCAFGVKAGKFLGYVITQEGIKVNQDKVEAVLRMTPPRSIKEVQSLAGKMVALARFISRMADKSLPFFKVLRKTAQFEWSNVCQLVEVLKVSLSRLPVLSTLERSETLFVYLSVGDEAVSLVLFKEVNSRQLPIYYISRILTSSETKYSEVEKIAYALVLTTRRLRPYFLSHTIVICTSLPLRQTLGQPTASGRIVKWAVELGQYKIQYQPRTSVKGQALVDFIRETTTIHIENEWKIYVDGSSTASGAGAGVIIIDPTGMELEFAIKLPRVSNNEAEYEAVIRGMEIAQELVKCFRPTELGARVIQVNSDSQLVILQLEGDYEIKNAGMGIYVSKGGAVQEAFEACPICQFRGKAIQRAVFLAKMGLSVLDCVERKISIFIVPPPPPPQFSESRYSKKKKSTGELLYSHTFRENELERPESNTAWHTKPSISMCDTEYYTKEISPRWTRGVWERRKFAPLIHKPGEEMIIMSAPCPFAQWGIDLVGPFPQTIGRKKFLIDAVDYFTKWVEVEALSKISEDEVMHFIWKNICCRFGLPRSLVSDNGTQFNGKKIRAWSVIPVEVAIDTLRITTFDNEKNNDALRAQLDEVFDLREEAYLHMERSKNLIKARYDRGVRSRTFQIGDLVLRRADALKNTGKLEANWEGPYTVAKCLAGGGYELTDMEGKALPRAWNIAHLKRFFA
ncbi:PREDICTED: uncharacterized protein LOC105972487 [Erythranthe guttata]|uniref:uncharacterized protein LOC105972487 n=1 Tax=Erythranthe guttata TaxID=4155 RepID=UPI00064DF003|nr:PREDICTED: uncharacterized protein LOC105972487 [Erythranthe guttata]|eukprot:XP_012852903.1 PREDICTED: uncharacterized protein LOC105972487 [Erythranthe guttata]